MGSCRTIRCSRPGPQLGLPKCSASSAAPAAERCRSATRRYPAMIEHYKQRRPCFLLHALDDAKKSCRAPDKKIGRHRSDQYWLGLFSSSSETVTAENAHEFFKEYRLVRLGAGIIKQSRKSSSSNSDRMVPTSRIGSARLAQRLRNMVTRQDKQNRQQTSAASKVLFFTRPCDEVYIWDQFASRSAQFREWLRADGGANPRRFGHLYSSGGEHDYGLYCASCCEILAEERTRNDFSAAIEEFRAFLRRVGGLMADPETQASSFVERHFLDKLMMCEGRWVKDRQDSGE